MHVVEYYAAMKRSEALLQATAWWTLNTRCSVRDAGIEGHTVCEPVDRKRPECAKPCTQKADPWLSGSRGKEARGGTAPGDRVSFQGDGNF